MIITADILLGQYSACSYGVAQFSEMYPTGLDTTGWTLVQQLAVIKTPLRRWWGWATQNGILPAWSMRGADLRGADLSRADMTGVA